jgi:hypothetical protein
MGDDIIYVYSASGSGLVNLHYTEYYSVSMLARPCMRNDLCVHDIAIPGNPSETRSIAITTLVFSTTSSLLAAVFFITKAACWVSQHVGRESLDREEALN